MADVKKASSYLKLYIIACLHHQCTGHGLFMSTTLGYFNITRPPLALTVHPKAQTRKNAFLFKKMVESIQSSFLPINFKRLKECRTQRI
jgi:hypothetical protein